VKYIFNNGRIIFRDTTLEVLQMDFRANNDRLTLLIESKSCNAEAIKLKKEIMVLLTN